jgi:hypothetical protein
MGYLVMTTATISAKSTETRKIENSHSTKMLNELEDQQMVPTHEQNLKPLNSVATSEPYNGYRWAPIKKDRQ